MNVGYWDGGMQIHSKIFMYRIRRTNKISDHSP